MHNPTLFHIFIHLCLVVFRLTISGSSGEQTDENICWLCMDENMCIGYVCLLLYMLFVAIFLISRFQLWVDRWVEICVGAFY